MKGSKDMFDFLPASARHVHDYAFIRFDADNWQESICCIIGYDENMRTEVRSTKIKSLTCDATGNPISATTFSGSTYTFNGQALTEFKDIKGMYHLELAVGLDRGIIYHLISHKSFATIGEFSEAISALNDKIDTLISPIEVDGKLVGIRHKTMTARIISAQEVLSLMEAGTM